MKLKNNKIQKWWKCLVRRRKKTIKSNNKNKQSLNLIKIS